MKTVWTFTNQKELNKSQFLDYVERKVFRTIRKYNMLPKNKIITLGKYSGLSIAVLKKILETKFRVEISAEPNLSSDNLSQIAEDIFQNILRGKYKVSLPINEPLYFLSDKEIELYAKLSSIEGVKREQDKKIQTLFNKFLKKNQDLELNVVKAYSRLNGKKYNPALCN